PWMAGRARASRFGEAEVRVPAPGSEHHLQDQECIPEEDRKRNLVFLVLEVALEGGALERAAGAVGYEPRPQHGDRGGVLLILLAEPLAEADLLHAHRAAV